jgi:hypothetical protein
MLFFSELYFLIVVSFFKFLLIFQVIFLLLLVSQSTLVIEVKNGVLIVVYCSNAFVRV